VRYLFDWVPNPTNRAMEEREAVVRDFMIILKFFCIKPTGNFLADLKTLGMQTLLFTLSYETHGLR